MNKITIREEEDKIIIQENISEDTEITCKKNSKLEYYMINLEDQELEITITLEEGSSINMKNIMLSEKQKQSNNIKIIHDGKKTNSKLENKAILSNSDVEIRGLIEIKEGAEESEGFQRSDFLILKNSKAISIPELEIKNNNVKCTHSSSITRLDEEKIFYLQTRGINKKDASELMIKAFIEEALKNIESKERERITKILNEKISIMEKSE